MPSIKSAIICSAGRGSRLGHMIPKACVDVGGKSLIQWQLEALKDIRNVAVVVGYRKNYVIDEILTHRNNVTIVMIERPSVIDPIACNIHDPVERPCQLGTVINGDVIERCYLRSADRGRAIEYHRTIIMDEGPVIDPVPGYVHVA